MLVGCSIWDITAGQYAVSEIHAASHMAMNYFSSGKTPRRNGTASQITCPWQSFDCQDKPIMIAVGNDSQFTRLCELLSPHGVAEDERYSTNLSRIAHSETLVPLIAEKFKQRNVQEWYELLDENNIPAGPLNDFNDVFAMPQVEHRELLKSQDHPNAKQMQFVDNPVKFTAMEQQESKHPPLFGEHTSEILAEAGYTRVEIDDLL